MENERRNFGDKTHGNPLRRDQEGVLRANVEGRSYLSDSCAGEDDYTGAMEMTSISITESLPSSTNRLLEHIEGQYQSDGRGDHSTDPVPQKSMAPTRDTQGPADPLARLRSPAARWLAELLSFIVGIGALIAIIVLMARYNKNELPQWPSGINLSAVVAALATLLRSMLMQVVEPSMCTQIRS